MRGGGECSGCFLRVRRPPRSTRCPYPTRFRSLARYGRLPVVAPEDKERIRPGHVYVAPPGYHMLVDADETIALSMYRAVHFSRPSIDELFFSAEIGRAHV